MEGKNIPPFITLSAAMVACIICIVRKAPLFNTLWIVLLVMFVFYIIGRIVQKVWMKINADAEEAALQRQREEQELAAKELEAAEIAAREAERAAEGQPEGLNEQQETQTEAAGEN